MSIRYKLGKEATAWELSGYIKDLRYLNRNLSRVICIDYDINNVKYTPLNVIVIPEFNGDSNDKELLLLIQLLKDMSKSTVKDVRKMISTYGNYKPYLNYYKQNPRYHKLLPDEYLNDQSGLNKLK